MPQPRRFVLDPLGEQDFGQQRLNPLDAGHGPWPGEPRPPLPGVETLDMPQQQQQPQRAMSPLDWQPTQEAIEQGFGGRLVDISPGGPRASERGWQAGPEMPAQQQNPTLAALMGGVGGRVPSFNEFIQSNAGGRPELVPQMAQAYNQLANTGVAYGRNDLGRTQLLGAGGLPGQLATNAQQVANMGRAADLQFGPDAQNTAAFNSFAQQRLASGSSLDDVMRQWQEARMRVPVFAGGPPISGSSFAPGAPRAMPGEAGGVPMPQGGNPADPGQLGPPLPVSPQSRMDTVYRTLLNRRGVLEGNQRRFQPGDMQAITQFVNDLGSTFVNENIRQLMPFMVERFGSGAVDPWAAQTFMVGSQDPHNMARQTLMQAVERVAPGTWGTQTAQPSQWWNAPGWLGYGIGRLADRENQAGQQGMLIGPVQRRQ